MNIRPSILWFTAIVAVLIAVAVWQATKKPQDKPTTTFRGRPSADSNYAVGNPNVLQETSNSATAAVQSQSASRGDNTDLLRSILNANDTEIVFYGRLADQASNGVGGAQVDFSIQYENANDRGIKRGQTVSDGNGFFTISGYSGATLGIVPKKPGYVLATRETSYRYSQISPGFFVPDANNPTEIKMWKLQGAIALTSINLHQKLHYTNSPLYCDLLTGQIVSTGGDLKIIVSRPNGVISGRNRLDWNVQIDAVDGGLLPSSGQESVTYWAPETGYKPSITLTASTNGHGVELIQEGLFVRSRNGQSYSKITFSLRINSEPDGFMNVSFSGVANTNGSRNWEGDPNTMKSVGQ